MSATRRRFFRCVASSSERPACLLRDDEEHESHLIGLFHGHFHNGLRGWDDHHPVHEVLFPSALYNQDRKLEAQKAPVYNPEEFRPGYTQVIIENGTVALRYRVVGTDGEVEKTLPISPA